MAICSARVMQAEACATSEAGGFIPKAPLVVVSLLPSLSEGVVTATVRKLCNVSVVPCASRREARGQLALSPLGLPIEARDVAISDEALRLSTTSLWVHEQHRKKKFDQSFEPRRKPPLYRQVLLHLHRAELHRFLRAHHSLVVLRCRPPQYLCQVWESVLRVS